MTLEEFFGENPRAALAYSGGADSAFLLYAGIKYGADIKPIYISSPFQPEFEKKDAARMAELLGVDMDTVELDILKCDEVRENSPQRCYFCKRKIMSAVKKRADAGNYSLVIDGTNCSDPVDDRPGMRALAEMGILSPLRICGLTKPEIRRLSREAGLFTWNKPAYACLATRIPTGTEIRASCLEKVEKAESILSALGYSDFRVRLKEGSAFIQMTEDDREKAEGQKEYITNKLGEIFDSIIFDPKARERSL